MELLVGLLFVAFVVSVLVNRGRGYRGWRGHPTRHQRISGGQSAQQPRQSGIGGKPQRKPELQRSNVGNRSPSSSGAKNAQRQVLPNPVGKPNESSAQSESVAPRLPPFDDVSARKRSSQRSVVGRARIVDGDTVVIKKTQIRLFGIDAPELDHPYGKKAKWALVRLCKGQDVRAEILEEDAYGRTVAKCFLPDGRDLSAEMVEQGLAIDWPKFSGGVYSRLETQDARKKLWLAVARQNGHMNVWEKFEAKKAGQTK